MSSPHPTVTPDAEEVKDQGEMDSMNYFMQTYSMIERTKSLLEQYASLAQTVRVDRTGVVDTIEENKVGEEIDSSDWEDIDSLVLSRRSSFDSVSVTSEDSAVTPPP